MDYSCSVEGDITEDRAVESSECLLTANSCRLPNRGHRMSLFLQIVVLRDICSASRTIQVEVKEFFMKKILTKYGTLALAVALMVPLAQAQAPGIQTAFGKDAGT